MSLTPAPQQSINPLAPIQRKADGTRLNIFLNNETTIYNKFSPYDQAVGGNILSSTGPKQPFVYTKLTDSEVQKNLTRFDSQALPVGSTVRDLERIGKFLVTGNGLLFITKQGILQSQNAYNETRIYNPASVLGATAKAGTFGITGRPVRFIRSSGGLVDFFTTAVSSAVGIPTRDLTSQYIEGTAGSQANSPLPTYDRSGRAGLVRLNTAVSAISRVDTLWAGATDTRSFAQQLGTALIGTLKSFIPSTNPLGIVGGRATNTWQYRPEYRDGSAGIYYSFLNNQSLLGYDARRTVEFYNGTRDTSFGIKRFVPKQDFHKNYPQEITTTPRTDDQNKWYSSKGKTQTELINKTRGVVEKFNRMISTYNLETIVGFNENNASTERFLNNIDAGVTLKTNYKAIPSEKNAKPYYNFFKSRKATIEDRGFSSNGARDTYNALSVTKKKSDLYSELNPNNSKDLIFFYFYDLINKVYVPFRATVNGIYDSHSPKWEDIRYMGRADTLYVYQGFTRDVNFNFRVYANSIHELIPMWERVNYMVGLTRPSKYTGKATVREEEEDNQNLASNVAGQAAQIASQTTTGDESGFIYPPMIQFRLGDMFVDQPAIIGTLTVSVPEDANWETLRNDKYEYFYGAEPGGSVIQSNGIAAVAQQFSNTGGKSVKKDAKSRQLPTIVDLSVNLRLFEKTRSITKGNHYGPQKGWKQL